MMRNWPVSSVTAVRIFSMRTGLEASTLTPGSTAPDVSRTTPVMEDCWPKATEGTTRRNAETSVTWVSVRMTISLHACRHVTAGHRVAPWGKYVVRELLRLFGGRINSNHLATENT